MIEIKVLQKLALLDLQRIATGYTTNRLYAVTYMENMDDVSLGLRAMPLDKPFVKEWVFDAATLARYKAILCAGYSFGAYEGDLLVGVAIAEAQEWNHSMWVWEFHVAEAYRQQGIGRQLMHAVEARAREAGFRVLVCETQNKNSQGIDVYRQLGFHVEGIDISYYTNGDYPDGEVAVFMKKRLD